MTGIYCYYNKINGKRYIGQATDLERRQKDHKVRAFNNFDSNNEYNSVIHKAFRKYGYDNFEYSILEECLVEELNDKESYWIQYYNSKENGYNCNNGGADKHFCKLNPDILENIRQDLAETELTFDEIRIKHRVSIGFVGDFNNGKIWKQDNLEYPIRKPREKKKYFCVSCGREIIEKTTTGMCLSCYYISSRLVERPSREELKALIRNTSFVEIGRQYGVTDNSIRKWCDSYQLPRRKSDIVKYTDTEWLDI